MFGFSFGELVVLMIVGVVVIGPKELPRVLRTAGQWASKLRRMASDIRTQSGIDEVLRGEGIAQDIAEIRKLARGEMDNVARATRLDNLMAPAVLSNARPDARDPYAAPPGDDILIMRDREYPREGADSRGALPDTALVYANTLPASPLARDPLYILGDAAGVLPPVEPPPPPPAEDPSPGDPLASADAPVPLPSPEPAPDGEPAPPKADPTEPHHEPPRHHDA